MTAHTHDVPHNAPPCSACAERLAHPLTIPPWWLMVGGAFALTVFIAAMVAVPGGAIIFAVPTGATALGFLYLLIVPIGIGRSEYVFHDRAGAWHYHIRPPTFTLPHVDPAREDDCFDADGRYAIADVARYNRTLLRNLETGMPRGAHDLDALVAGPIFTLRCGGIFRSYGITWPRGGKHGPPWRIARCWRGLDGLVITDGVVRFRLPTGNGLLD